MKNKKILISGASVAGPTLAFWLNKYGFETIIVERTESLRLGGQNIDVKGAGQEVARKMGIEDEIRAANTNEIGVRFVDENNQVEAEFPKENSSSLTSELEILRGDLAQILYDRTKNETEYIFGDYIAALEQDESAVKVRFESGKTESFDLVIAADGIGSNTRKLMFGDEPKIEYLGLLTAYLTIPKKETDTRWSRWYTAPDSRMILIRPDNHGTTRASFNFLSDDRDARDLPVEKQKALLKEKLTGAGWEAYRIADELDQSDDFYFDAVSQVKAPRWSNGRFAMIGDAAYCASPVTGMGTTLALVGAYILAGELSKRDDHEQAFAAYDKLFRPFVEEKQKLPPGVPWIVYPKSDLGVKLVNTAAGILASDVVSGIKEFFASNKKSDAKDDFILPEYETDRNKFPS